MAKYLALSDTTTTTEEVTPITASAGAADSGKIPQTDSSGRLDASLMPVGIAADVHVGTASGALSAGDFCYVHPDGTIRRASAAVSGNGADGFVLAAVQDGQQATLYLEGRNTARSGLTVGARYFLSDSAPGGCTTTPPTGTGKLWQYLGKAISATSIAFEADDPIRRA